MEVSVKEIKEIIKTCAESGVESIKIGETTIVFHKYAENTPEVIIPDKKVKDNPKKRIEVEQESIDRTEIKVKEDYIDNLLLEEPSEYERLQIQGELSEETHERGPESNLQ